MLPALGTVATALLVSSFAAQPAELAAPIFIDFSDLSHAAPAPCLTFTPGGELLDMQDANGNITSIDFYAVGPVSHNNRGGLAEPEVKRLQRLAIHDATADYFYTTNGGPDAKFVFAGLNPKQQYTVTCFGSREADTLRVTRYALRGAGDAEVAELKTSGPGTGNDGKGLANDHATATLTTYPDADGKLEFSFGSGNNSFGYLNLLVLEPAG